LEDRVGLFIDYQNVYMRARESFAATDGNHTDGQIDPLRLGQLLIARSPFSRKLTEVRVYRGQPDSTRDPKGYAACERQCNRWRRAGVTVVTRTLRYPADWPNSSSSDKPREKGIDVALAIDYAMMAVRSEFDVAILMSTDTDLKPALEVVSDQTKVRAEVAAWSTPGAHSRRLSIVGRQLWCHWLNADNYIAVADPTDYNRP